jgi:hypothetical protein
MPNGSCDDNVGNWDIHEGYDEEDARVDAQIEARSSNNARSDVNESEKDVKTSGKSKKKIIRKKTFL